MTARRWVHPLIIVVITTVVGAVAVWRLNAPSGRPLVAIVTAFSAEAAPIAAAMTDTTGPYTPDVRLLRGRLGGMDVALIVTGPGMVNAAASTQHAIDTLPITHVIVSGIAGGLDADITAGTVVVPDRWINHQFVTLSDDGLEPLGIALPGIAPASDGVTVFHADEALLLLAAGIDGVTLRSVGISGDAFVAGAAARDDLRLRFDASIVDMESAAVAQVALLNDIPFLAVRAVSDSAAATARTDIAATMDTAASAAARVVITLVEMMRE